MTAQDVLSTVIEAGGRLTPNGDKLTAEAPAPLPPEVLALVRQHKSALLALLHQEPPLPSDNPGQLTRVLQPWERPGACYACGSARRWHSMYGAQICVRCHPPADTALVTCWAGEDMEKIIDPKEGAFW